MLVYDHKYRLVPHLKMSGRWGVDAIINVGGAAGNISTNVNSGLEIRTGWNLPTDFGTALIRPGGDTNAPVDTSDIRYVDDYKTFSAHIFFATAGRLVIRDIFLDGNSFASSHNVDKKLFVADFIFGAAAVYSNFKLTYAHVLRSREFDGEPGGHDFGSISLSYTY
jgi:lipid A 3-O-deacylase